MKWLFGFGATAMALAIVSAAWQGAPQKSDVTDPAYLEQLRLARAEGLPTTPAEFKATVKSVPESENAAPFYKLLEKRRHGPMPSFATLERKLLSEPSNETTREAKNALASQHEWLDLAEQAVAKPHCWFDRDWTLGPAILLPELAYGKNLARLVLLRGSVAAKEGRPKDALADARRAQKMAEHFGEDPGAIGRLVSRSIFDIAIRDLATWSFRFRANPDYFVALKEAVAHYPKLDLQAEYRFELVSILALLDLCDTKEGRDRLGLREEDLPPNDKIFTSVQSRAEGRVKIVKGVRMQWAAVKNPKDHYGDRLQAASSQIYQGLLSFLTAAKVYEALDSGGTPGVEPLVYDARLTLYQATLRALTPGPIPKTIKTKDLISPLDGKPIRYRYDGKQIVLDAGLVPQTENHIWLKLPPDEPKTK